MIVAISVRNLDERVKELLRVRAARHGRSMESDLFRAVIDRFSAVGGVELELPERSTATRYADLDT